MNWPNNADGDALRRLKDEGFDFSTAAEIDFMVDFENWPPPNEAIDLLAKKFGSVEVYEPEDDGEGYLLVQVCDRVSYELLIHYQDEISLIMGKFSGWCDSWGVMNG